MPSARPRSARTHGGSVRPIEPWRRRQRQQRAAEKRRKRNEIVGTGKLHRVITEAATRSGLSLKALTVLSPKNDPFRRDTVEGHRNGQWFAEQVERLLKPGDQIHLRGLHYLLVVAANIRKPDGQPYVNDEDCWTWLIDKAAKDARWLAYVPFERIRDERNERPIVVIIDPQAEPGWARGEDAELPEVSSVESYTEPYVGDLLPRLTLPDVAELVPSVELVDFDRRQPYRIILFGEKTSLAAVLRPLAAVYGTELILPTGETTDTLLYEAAQRAADDGRPAVVLDFSRFRSERASNAGIDRAQITGAKNPALPRLSTFRSTGSR